MKNDDTLKRRGFNNFSKPRRNFSLRLATKCFQQSKGIVMQATLDRASQYASKCAVCVNTIHERTPSVLLHESYPGYSPSHRACATCAEALLQTAGSKAIYCPLCPTALNKDKLSSLISGSAPKQNNSARSSTHETISQVETLQQALNSGDLDYSQMADITQRIVGLLQSAAASSSRNNR